MTRQRGLVQDVEHSSIDQEDDVTTQIITRVASHEGVEPETLSPPLYDAVEPEAVASLVESASADAPLSLEFRYSGYKVTVEAAEDIDIDVTPV